MKRDPELIRSLLFFFEQRTDHSYVKVTPIRGCLDREITYHMVLLAQAGLISYEPTKSTTSDRVIRVVGFDLTWEGHEFLESARQDDTWRAVIKKFFDAGVGISVDLLKEALKAETKSRLGLPLQVSRLG